MLSAATAKQVGHGDINVVMLGDSNTWIGGDDCNDERGWNKWFKDFFKPASCRSYARSGATWTNTARTKENIVEDIPVLGDDNVIYNQIMRLRLAVENGTQPIPNLIIIAAGTNDAWFNDKRPNVFSSDAEKVFENEGERFTARPVNMMTSLAESVRFGCELLKESFPAAQIVLLTPLQCTATSIENIKRAGNIIEDCAKKMNICVIRQDRLCCINRNKEIKKRLFTSDGTHTNAKGARRNGIFLSRQISSLLIKEITRKNKN